MPLSILKCSFRMFTTGSADMRCRACPNPLMHDSTILAAACHVHLLGSSSLIVSWPSLQAHKILLLLSLS